MPRRAVLDTVRPGPFGHEHMADRAQAMLWAHAAFGKLPRHVASLDVGAVRASGELCRSAPPRSCSWSPSSPRVASTRTIFCACAQQSELRPLDFERADALCDYLVEIHRVPGPDPGLYARRIRELVGHGECIFGVADSYPQEGPVPFAVLEEIERKCVAWRWRLKSRAAAPAPGARRLPSLEHPVSRRRRLHRARPLARRVGRARRRRHLPRAQLPLLLAAALADKLEGDFEQLWLRFWERYLERSRRPRDPRGGGAVSRLPRPGHGQSALVSGARRAPAAQAAELRAATCWRKRASIRRAPTRTAKHELRRLAHRAFRLGQERHREAAAGPAPCARGRCRRAGVRRAAHPAHPLCALRRGRNAISSTPSSRTSASISRRRASR